MSFTIRELAKTDRPGWESLWGGYLDFYEARMEPVVIEVLWSRLHDPAEPMLAYVAEDDETKELIIFATSKTCSRRRPLAAAASRAR